MKAPTLFLILASGLSQVVLTTPATAPALQYQRSNKAVSAKLTTEARTPQAAAMPNTKELPGPAARIVGGSEVMPKFRYPFLVSLQRFKRHFCGGTLIRPDVVLTAAHCTIGLLNFGFDAVHHRHDLEASDEDEGAQRRRVIQRKRHEEFDQTTVKNDIAIWHLEPTTEPSPYPELLKGKNNGGSPYIKLDDGALNLGGKGGPRLGRVAGWGTTSSGGPASTKLLEIKVPFYNMDKCERLYRGMGGFLDRTVQICAGYPEGGRDACQGDSGGPFFVNMGANEYLLVGVVSWGLGCAQADLPGIYTRVSSYRDWIDQNL